MAEPRTSLYLAQLFEATLPQLQALAAIVSAHALRHATKPVPAQLLSDAEAILIACRRVLGREPVAARLVLGVPPDWAELDAKLALALAGFRSFRARFYGFDAEAGLAAWRLTTRPARLAPPSPNTMARRAIAQLERQIDRLEKDI